MKKIFTSLTILLFVLLFKNDVKASHLMGADISYTCLGGNQYQITLSLYRDCSGINLGATATIVYMSPTCSPANTTATLNQVGSINEVTPVCPSQIVNTTCNGGILPGVQQFVYQGVITLPCQATDWVVYYETCCRNGGITTIPAPSGLGFRVEAKINNVTPLCDNSPVFTSLPVPYVCVNQPFNYNQGAYDVDGDSLIYNLVYPMGTGGSTILYNAPFNNLYPLQTTTGNITFDQATGQMTFTPNAIATTVIAMRIDEYRNGLLIGSTMRDMQMWVLSCNNQSPTTTGISNVTGGQQAGPTLITVCPGQTVTFSITANDPDPLDTVTAITNLAAVMPTATFTTSGVNPLTGNFSWQPSGLDTGFHSFTIAFFDNGCPIIGQNFYSVQIYVSPGTSAGPDQTICGGGGAQLQATGGSVFNWTPSTGLSCTNCSNPIANPAATTTYIVTSNLIGTCNNTDTMVVFVVTPYTYTISNDTSICLNQTAFLHVTPSASGAPYTYQWTANTTAANATINAGTTANPAMTPTVTTTYYVTITSAQGCIKQDSVVITIAGVAPMVTANASQYQICPGQSTNLSVAALVPATYCQPTYSIACSSGDYIDNFSFNTLVNNGTGCNGNLTPNQNYIYYSGGPTTTVNPGSTYTLSCQSGTTWSQGIGVWIDYNQNGVFTDPGEFVYATPSASTLPNSTTITIPGSALPGVTRLRVMCRYAITIVASDCCNANCSFGECEDYDITVTGAGGPNVYSWSPTTGLSNPAITNPVATPTTTTTYTVTVTNGGFCSNSDTVLVTVNTGYQVNAGPDQYVCIGTPATLTGSNGTTYSWTSNPAGFTSSNASITVTNNVNTQYILLGTDPIGCQDLDTAWVYMNQVAGFSAGSDAAICLGNNYTMAPVGNWVTYSWAPAAGLSATNIANPVASPAATTTYTLTITDANGCTGIDSMVLTVNVPIVPAMSSDTSICIGEAANLTATPGVVFSWSPNTGLSNAAGSFTTASPNGTTTYTCTVTDINGCISTGQVVVTIFPTNFATAGNDTSILPGLSAQLNATNPNGINYTWSPIDYLNDPNIANPIANPTATTTYTVSMTDVNGCITNDDVIVILQPACQGVINATAFTPNGDGLNDVCKLIHMGYDELVEFDIYNRWGAKIFSTNNFNEGWDGTFNGLECEIGTYVWVAKTLCDGNANTQSGNVTLLR